MGSDDHFAPTRWTVVLAAQHPSDSHAAHALEELCTAYWFPLYAYVRRRGHSREDAEDLTQAFFSRFLEKSPLDGVSAGHGRFRAFLLASMKHFLANEWDRSQRLKRGGGALHLSLEWETADSKFQLADSTGTSPDTAYDREWAVTLLSRVLDRLRTESAADEKEALFEGLKAYLTLGKDALPYADTAATLGIDAGTIRVAVHRLRKRYRRLLREEIAQTLADPSLVDGEMDALFAAFRR